MTIIKEFENYAVDEQGNVFSLPKKTRKGTRILKYNIANNGYAMLDLCKDGNIKRFLVHRLIAETLLPNPDNKPQVNHKNGNKLDNRIENLEWNTRSENQKHAIQIGLRTANGEKNSQSKLTEQEVLYIRESKEKGSILAKKLNISHPTICDIRKNRSWKHV
jgi:hypothetical protein